MLQHPARVGRRQRRSRRSVPIYASLQEGLKKGEEKKPRDTRVKKQTNTQRTSFDVCHGPSCPDYLAGDKNP